MDFNLPDVMDTITLSEKGVALPILRPDTGQPLINDLGQAVTITVYGPDSKIYAKSEREAQKARVAASMRAEEVDDESMRVDLLARVTKSWTGIADKKGGQVNCTPEVAAAIYTQFPLIRDQVANFVTNRRNFIKASPAASLPSPAIAGA
jgi:hypothetical protein